MTSDPPALSPRRLETNIVYLDKFGDDDHVLMPDDDELGNVAGEKVAADQSKKPLPLVKFDDVTVDRTSNYLVDGIIDRGATSMLYGDSNTGKTFAVLDLALHVATGRPYFGRNVQQGAVIYVATEAGRSAETRVAAWRQHHNKNSAPFWVVPYPTNLLGDLDTDRLIETIKQVSAQAQAAGLRVELIVIDTLSRALAGGNENDSKDMGTFVRHIDKLRIASGAHVLIVHHCGKDQAKGARGHSLLRAAVDTELEIANKTITATKQRDMDYGVPIRFGLRVVELGLDAKGKMITSCVVGPPDTFGIPRKEMDEKERAAHEVLNEVVDQKREKPGQPDDVGASWREWLTAYARCEGVMFKDYAELRKHAVETALRRIVATLKAKGWVGKNGRDEYVTVESP